MAQDATLCLPDRFLRLRSRSRQDAAGGPSSGTPSGRPHQRQDGGLDGVGQVGPDGHDVTLVTARGQVLVRADDFGRNCNGSNL
jgi:hypothetical protein